MHNEPQQKNPKVSVLMTAYNRELFIREAIESVLESSYENFELIIVDDGSLDDTINIAQHYAEQDGRVKFYRNEKNLGDYPNRNKASSYATGKYLMHVDSDDKIYPDSLEYCVTEMENTPHADMGILCRDQTLCGKTLSPQESVPYHFFKKPFLIIGPGGTILKRTFFDSVARYPIKYGPANDMYFNLKAASLGNIKCLCKEFLFYRIHEGQEINNEHSYLFNNYRYLNDALEELNLSLTDKEKRWLVKKSKRRLTVNLVKYFLRTGSMRKVRDITRQTGFRIKDAMQGIFH